MPSEEPAPPEATTFDHAAYERARRSRHLGAVVHYLERTRSTMDDAREGAARGEPPGAVYVAGEQEAGRGRQGRTWLSAASVGLYATFHLHAPEAARAPLLSIAGALAASDAILEASGLATDLKWPNDVLHEGRKLCGVLAESRAALGRPGVDVFLGVGINVRAAELPPEVATIATSIEAAGATPPSREALLGALATHLERWADLATIAPEALIAAWRGRLVTLGHRVRLATPSGPVEGDAVDVTPSGELVLRLDDGTEVSFAAGDVTTLR